MRAQKGAGSKYFDKTRQRYIFEKYYYTVAGVKKRKIITAKKRKDLERKIQEWEKTLVDGRESFAVALTIDDVTKVWLNAVKTSIKESTWKLYRGVMNSHVLPVFGSRKPDTIEAVEIQYWLNGLLGHPLSPRTCNIIRATWCTCFDWAFRQGLIRRNPLRGVRTLRDNPKPVKALSKDELDRLLAVARDGTYYPFVENDFGKYLQQEVVVAVTLASRTGMRRGEIFGLKWENIEFSKDIIHVINNLNANKTLSTPKTLNSTRNILIDSDTVTMLKSWQNYQRQFMTSYCGITEYKDDFIFTTQTGTPVSVDNFRSRQWKALTNAAGLPGLGFHALRHTHATLLIAAGVPVKVVSERLGHKDVAMTMRIYVSVLPTMQRMAVDVIQKMIKNENAPSAIGVADKDKGDEI